MNGEQPMGHRGALRAWRASINVSELFSKLVIVDRNDVFCDECGRPIGRGTEAYRGCGRALMHVGCSHPYGGPKGQ